MESCENSFIDLRINFVSLVSLVLFLISEILGVFGTKHSIAQYLKFCIFWIYIKCFPDSTTAQLVASVSSTRLDSDTISTKKYPESVTDTLVEIGPLPA
jgi:hypothetical protein